MLPVCKRIETLTAFLQHICAKVCKLLHGRGLNVIATVRRRTPELSGLGTQVVEGARMSGRECFSDHQTFSAP
jgi:hypothetical protein